MSTFNALPIEEIYAAQKRIAGAAIQTPLIPLNASDAPAQIYLKLENMQPIGCFKLRGSRNAMMQATKEELANGVYTASAGNMAQGVAWNAQRLQIPCTVVVPDHAPETKLSAIRRLNGEIIKVPFSEWWQILISHEYPPLKNMFFIHPVSDPAVMAGNGTIGLEILEALPDVDTILIPYGGGGLSCGIASAIRAKKSNTKIFACEVETAAPLAASLNAGMPKEIEYTASFVDGIGGKSVLAEMWPRASYLLDGSIVCSLEQIASAIRLLAERNRVIAEGAGAASVAAGLSGKAGSGKIVCIVSGGNIDSAKLAKILVGEMP